MLRISCRGWCGEVQERVVWTLWCEAGGMVGVRAKGGDPG